MVTLLKNVECYTPEYIGKKDLFITCHKICKITAPGGLADQDSIAEVMDCEGLIALPGFIDQHVHIIGGGGEEGFASRIPEINFEEIVKAGVTTLCGLLGADGCTRTLEALYAKAKALELDGITTYLYAGSYAIPPVTFTGGITRDLILIDKVIGAGEIAISDHRSSQPETGELLKLAAQVHLGGLLSGKAGVLHLHVGDGKEGLAPVLKMAELSDLPKEMFVPTHVNRNPRLFRQAIEYCKAGGHIDLTAGEANGIPVPKAIRMLTEQNLDLSAVTVSSDANGSIPQGGTVNIQVLYEDVRDCILKEGIEPETALRLATVNVAKTLHLYPEKGTIREGSDADLLITDHDYRIQMVFAKGKRL